MKASLKPTYGALAKFPEIRLPDGARRPQLVIAFERFKSEVDWADSHDGRALIRVLEPIVLKAKKKASALLRAKIDAPSAFALPKKASPQALKAEVKVDLDRLSHLVAFRLSRVDLETRVGKCVTCPHVGVLQWGHVVSQSDCPWLGYHPHNTRGQCGGCNGPGQGRYREFRAALESERPGRAAELEALALKYGRRRPTLQELRALRDRLQAVAVNIGAV